MRKFEDSWVVENSLLSSRSLLQSESQGDRDGDEHEYAYWKGQPSYAVFTRLQAMNTHHIVAMKATCVSIYSLIYGHKNPQSTLALGELKFVKALDDYDDEMKLFLVRM